MYQPRLIDFDGISQGMGNESDDATFTFGNADRVMRDLANDVDLYRAAIAFSLFHVGTGDQARSVEGRHRQLAFDCWPGVQGHRVRWPVRIEPAVPDAEDLPHLLEGVQLAGVPVRRPRARWIWFTSPTPTANSCDKNYDTPNGCLAHGMKRYYGGIIAEPQGVRIKDNSTGVWGFGRSTHHQRVAGRGFDLRSGLPEVYTDSEMPVNCKVAAGRDESDFYEALGIVGEGPLVAYTAAHYEDQGSATATPRRFVGHTLDGQAHHGCPTNDLGIRTCLGADPAGAGDFFSLDQSGNLTGGDWRKVYSGNSTFKDNFAAGTAFIVIRAVGLEGPATLQARRPRDDRDGRAGYERVGVDQSRRARVRAVAGEPGLDRGQHAASVRAASGWALTPRPRS